jgi:hypothetical protein
MGLPSSVRTYIGIFGIIVEISRIFKGEASQDEAFRFNDLWLALIHGNTPPGRILT